ncbi:MAG: family 16 glycosylhydrolase [Robiginitalea sp.]
MNSTKILWGFLLIFLSLAACQEEEPDLTAPITPTNLVVNSEISQDGSGIVVFTASADNALNYKYFFSDGTTALSNGEPVTKRFTKTGLNTYQVTVTATGIGGLSSSTFLEVEVQSDFSDPETLQLLTGGSSKTWYLDVAQPAHLGVGLTKELRPDLYWFPTEFRAEPNLFCDNPNSSCFCDDEMTFSLNSSGQIIFELDNKGATFFNGANSAAGGGPGSGGDICLEFDTSGQTVVNLGPSEDDLPPSETTGTVMNLSGGGFLMYYNGAFSYEILSITENNLYVRSLDGVNPVLAWYLKFTATPPGESPGNDFDTLVFEEEFEVDGAPDASVWNYDLGTGDNGWGNNESQYYTDRPENIIVEDGFLKITARAEEFEGSSYTSARIQSYQKFEFQYGKVEVRAKLPAGGGTWPAIWMLGADFETNTWPAAGEIDIMEHVGNQQNTIYGSTHDPNNFAGDSRSVTTVVEGVSDDFHVYGLEWTQDAITFSVDGEEFGTLENNGGLPFNKDFFMILNVAMGGNFGGEINPAFTGSSMEVDYIRVYQ